MHISWKRTQSYSSLDRHLRMPLRRRLGLEELEIRNVLTSTGYSPAQILQAYGFSQLNLLNPGLGETIAVVDAYKVPQIQADLAAFDSMYNLPPINLTVINDGATGSDPSGSASLETALDVEWAQAVAPYAHIILVEAANDNVNSAGVPTALLHAVSVAASQPNVTVVSMSWGVPEFQTETQYDGYFSTPGVTYVASAGDNGAADAWWPALSPNVVSVGGTTLQAGATGIYLSETGWGNGSRSVSDGGSGGGISQYEPEPAYQQGGYATSVTAALNSGNKRMGPDVSYVANPSTGVAVYDQASGGWLPVGGTSAGTPQWAALVALADQERADATPAQPSLSSTQLLTALYQEQGDFHDVTSGNNGYAAGVGYDLVTGLGTPQANLLIPALVQQTSSPTPNLPPTNPIPPTSQHLENQLFVIQLYQILLGRTADAGGLTSWTYLLDQGTSRSSVVAQMEQGLEYRTDEVEAIYQKMLLRPADTVGLSAFTTLLANGWTLEQMETAVAGSPEYFHTRGGGQMSGFLSALYTDALGRAIDPIGQAAFGQALAQGAAPATVAAVVFTSQEYRQDLVEHYYQTYLGRPADAAGLAADVAALGQGVTDQAVIAAVVGSDEYFQKLPAAG